MWREQLSRQRLVPRAVVVALGLGLFFGLDSPLGRFVPAAQAQPPRYRTGMPSRITPPRAAVPSWGGNGRFGSGSGSLPLAVPPQPYGYPGLGLGGGGLGYSYDGLPQLYPRSSQAVVGYWERIKQFGGDYDTSIKTITESLAFRSDGQYWRAEGENPALLYTTAKGTWSYNPRTGAVTLTSSTGAREVLNFHAYDANSLWAANGLPFGGPRTE